jgi:hypothetical protein
MLQLTSCINSVTVMRLFLVPFFPVIWGYLVLIGASAKQKVKPRKPATDGLLALPCSPTRDPSRWRPGPLGNRCSILLSYRPTETYVKLN